MCLTTCLTRHRADTASRQQRTANDDRARAESRTWIHNEYCLHRETRKLKKTETYQNARH